MQVIVVATEEQKAQIGESSDRLLWINDAALLLSYRAADAFIDLTCVAGTERISVLKQLLPKPVIINSTVHTLQETHPAFVRINGWNTFLSSPVWEAASNDDERKQKAEAVFSLLNKKAEWLPDTPGFVTPKVVSMVINEAYLALEDGVSTKEEINTAMKLGTAYPYGPFEWAEKIGIQNIISLLQALAQQNHRYKPAGLLSQETGSFV